MTRFSAWLGSAQPGESHVYYTGSELPKSPTVLAVRRAYNDGLIELVQRRLSQPIYGKGGFKEPGTFEYIAVKRSEIAKVKKDLRFGPDQGIDAEMLEAA